MKRTIHWILVSVVACGISSLVTHRIAYRGGYERGYRNGTMDAIGRCRFEQSVAFFAALQSVRAGDIAKATLQMERSCFDSAQIYYKNPTPAGEISEWGRAQGLATYPDAATAKMVAQALSEYRAAYRTNSADWNDMERKLAVELANVK